MQPMKDGKKQTGSDLHAFAEWTAFSATRSGCPIKSRETVYPLIRIPNYQQLLREEEITTTQWTFGVDGNQKPIIFDVET